MPIQVIATSAPVPYSHRAAYQPRRDLDDAQRERLLQVANACPIHRLLSGTVEIQSTLAPVHP